MKFKILLVIPITLIIFVINLVFQISAHVENNHLTDTVYMGGHVFETLSNLNTPFSAPYWCYLIEIFVYLLQFSWIAFYCITEVLGFESHIPLVSVMSLDLAMIMDCAWVVLYNRYDILSFNILSVVQFILLLIGACFIVRVVYHGKYMQISKKHHVILKLVVMNSYFGYFAWSFYRLISDMAVGLYAYYMDGYWVPTIPCGVFVLGYFFYYIFDVIAFPNEFVWTLSPYAIFLTIFGGLLSDKELLSPSITLSGLILSCAGTIIVVTLLHKLTLFMLLYTQRFKRTHTIISKHEDI